MTTDAEKNADLFWALRGGGGNFGVVTSFMFRLSRVSRVLAGPMVWPSTSAECSAGTREFLPARPMSSTASSPSSRCRPGPPFPEELHLQKVCAVVWCYAGSDRSRACATTRAFGGPLPRWRRADPAAGLQSAFDGVYPAGTISGIGAPTSSRNSRRGDRYARRARRDSCRPGSRRCTCIRSTAAPAACRRRRHAWAYRDAKWAQVIVGVEPGPGQRRRDITRLARGVLGGPPSLLDGRRVHEHDDGRGQDRVGPRTATTTTRLAAIKAAYDPDNLFRVNQNIQPSS